MTVSTNTAAKERGGVEVVEKNSQVESFGTSDLIRFDEVSAKAVALESGQSASGRSEPDAQAVGKRVVRLGRDRLQAARNVRAASEPATSTDDLQLQIDRLAEAVRAIERSETLESATRQLSAMNDKLTAIAGSVEFTEAYASVGMADRIVERLSSELKDRQADQRRISHLKRRSLVGLFSAATLAVLLVAEIRDDVVTRGIPVLAETVGDWMSTLFERFPR
ncbi:hypothetical protein [Georhizobium sp. MAB10]|uniref:hypothetical protein n=1 Tax=Georhizobium sp. MAB10 TaxID=3028319 RepID=UPI003855C6A4